MIYSLVGLCSLPGDSLLSGEIMQMSRGFPLSMWDYTATQALPYYPMGLCSCPGLALFLHGIMQPFRGFPINPWDYAAAQGLPFFCTGLCSHPEYSLLTHGITHLPRAALFLDGIMHMPWGFPTTLGLR